MTRPEPTAAVAATTAAVTGIPPHHTPFRARFSWAMFDWANQPFFTIITTFIFMPYFTSKMVGDPVQGQIAAAQVQTYAGIIIAVLSPILGSIADAGGPRKPWVLAFQALTVVGCFMLWWAYPNRPDLLGFTMLALVIATIGAEFSIVFNNAQLPSLVPPQRMGRLSGLGWGLGYVGGLIALFVVLLVSGLANGGQPLFGLSKETYEVERLTGPASALWLIVFVLPMFLFTPDVRSSGLGKLGAIRQGVGSLVATIRALLHYRNPLLYLIAYMIYNDGLAAIIAFGGVYATGTFGWTTVSLGIFGIILTVFATVGAFVGGRLDDRVGSKRTVLMSLVGVIVATLGIVSVGRDSVLFVVAVAPPLPDGGLFASTPELVFMAFAVLLGICMGPMQAASRTMIGRMAPPGMTGEFYGLFALSGRATVFMAPAAIGWITSATQNQRAGVIAILPFLIVGFILLSFVRERQAERHR